MTIRIPIPIQENVTMAGSLRFGGRDYADSTMRGTMVDEKVYVAVTGKDPESKSSLLWAIKNTGGQEFCIVYVQSINFSAQNTKAHKNLDKYLHMCRNMQVSAEKICIEKESVEKGLFQLISERGVKKLVMGAAADKHYSMNMRDLQSKKAIHIRNEAPATCHIWFTCKGYLICSREARRRDNSYLESAPSSSVSESEITRGITSVPSSSTIRDDDRIRVTVKEAEDLKKKACFEASKRKEAEEAVRLEAFKRKKAEEAARIEASKLKKAEEAARIETSKRKKAEEAVLFEAYKRRESEEAARFQESKRIEAEEVSRFQTSKRKEAEEVARLEASKHKEAEETARFEASLRKEAVKAAKDAIKRAEQSENLYYEEWNHWRETEEALRGAIEQLEKTRAESENQIEKSNMVIRELQGKYSRLREKQEELKRELRLSKLKTKEEEEEASSSSSSSSSSTNRKPPEYFNCPITQDVMEDPYVAADGFTYEREAISGWFDRGNETSPMTNKRLPHTSLVPNLALRSAIKEWRQTSSS